MSGTPLERDYDGCFGCGQANEQGLRLKFSQIGEGEVECRFVPPEHLRGPEGVVHGGIQATLLDEVLGAAAGLAFEDDADVVTAEFQLRYRRPSPTGSELVILGRLRETDGRNVHVEGEIRSEGELCTTATARWVRVDGA